MKNKFKMPAKSKLSSRTSTISNSFAMSITPYINPTDEEVKNLYETLGISIGQCAYCLRESGSVDHFRSLVKDGMPSGYVTDITNLVPCCTQCNSKKGGKDWYEWYTSNENIKRLKDEVGLCDEQIQTRIEKLQAFEKNTKSYKIDFYDVLGDEYNEYIRRKEELNKRLKEEQEFCDTLLSKVEKYFEELKAKESQNK